MHRYRARDAVSGRKRIIAVLEQLKASHELLSVSVAGCQTAATSAILSVSDDRNCFMLDELSVPELHRRFLEQRKAVVRGRLHRPVHQVLADGDHPFSRLDALEPDDRPGRLVLISRMGAERVTTLLPPLIEAVRATGRSVVWSCDPMHGNTETLADGRKTRRFDNILSELEQSFAIHADTGSLLGGVHFELSGDNVTECVGGARGLSEVDLDRAYESRVDPRLNYEQAMEVAMRISGL